MKKIAVIPARSGSKRIPKKNIIDFMGKPLMVWTIEAAQKANIFDRIIVSTDDPEFAEVARKYGCEVPFLRDTKADDITPVSEATILAVQQAEGYYKEKYDIVVQLMANAPIRSDDDIKNHCNHFIQNNLNFQLSCFPFGWMNPWWSFKINEENRHEWLHPDAMKQRSQDLDKLFCPTGAIWIAKRDLLFKEKTFYGENFKFYEIDWKSAVDIDDYEDLEFAKAIFYLKRHHTNDV